MKDMNTHANKSGLLFFEEVFITDEATHALIKQLATKNNNELVSTKDTDFIKEYFQSPSVKDQVLSIEHVPGSGLNSYLVELGTKTNTKVLNWRMSMLDQNDSLIDLYNLIDDEKTILIIEDLNRAIPDVLINFLDLLNTQYKPNVKLIFTSIIADCPGFDITKYGDIAFESGPFKLINLV